MRQLIPRILVMCFLTFFFLHCAPPPPDSIGVQFELSDLPVNINSLYVTATLDGQPAMQGAEFTSSFEHFTIELPTNAIGTGRLVVDVTSLDNNRCELSKDQVQAFLSAATPFYMQNISLTKLPTPLCVDFSDTELEPINDGFQLVAGDFNGDMKLDLVVSPGDTTVATLLGQGNGMFATPLTSSAGPSYEYSGIAAGDFNGDQKLDLAVTSQNGLDVILGTGSGGFGKPSSIPITTTNLVITWVAVGDFNGDAKPDLAVSSYIGAGNGPSQVSVLLGTGTGSFASQSTSNTHSVSPQTEPTQVVVGDFNGDKKLDVAVLNRASEQIVSVLLGDGTGGLGSPTNIMVGLSPQSLAVGDFNGDMRADLVTGNSDNTASVLLSLEAGGFARTDVSIPGFEPAIVAVGDFNNDKKLDFALASQQTHSDNLAILLGDGMGNFGDPEGITFGRGANAMAVADFNSDGKLDIAILSRNILYMMLNQKL